MSYGFSQSEWDAAKAEARDLMIKRAKLSGLIAYSDLVAGITTISLAAHDPRLFHLLGEISSEEDAAGRGMLTVVVVHRSGDMQPGPGFFELAGQLGRDTSNIEKCSIAELRRVYDIWARENKHKRT